MNFRISFTACAFDKQSIEEWIDWLQNNIIVFTEIEIKQLEADHASDAKDRISPAKRLSK
jgi:hypothetical protein